MHVLAEAPPGISGTPAGFTSNPQAPPGTADPAQDQALGAAQSPWGWSRASRARSVLCPIKGAEAAEETRARGV